MESDVIEMSKLYTLDIYVYIYIYIHVDVYHDWLLNSIWIESMAQQNRTNL